VVRFLGREKKPVSRTKEDGNDRTGGKEELMPPKPPALLSLGIGSPHGSGEEIAGVSMIRR